MTDKPYHRGQLIDCEVCGQPIAAFVTKCVHCGKRRGALDWFDKRQLGFLSLGFFSLFLLPAFPPVLLVLIYSFYRLWKTTSPKTKASDLSNLENSSREESSREESSREESSRENGSNTKTKIDLQTVKRFVLVGITAVAVLIGIGVFLGETEEERVARILEVERNADITVAEFKSCLDKEVTYNEQCYGKTIFFEATIHQYDSSDGVRLSIKENCGNHIQSIDAPNLDLEYSEKNKGKCAKFLGKVGSRNFSTPDIEVIQTLSIETGEEFDLRLVAQKAIAAKQKAESERKKAELEKQVLLAVNAGRRAKDVATSYEVYEIACKRDWKTCENNADLVNIAGGPSAKYQCKSEAEKMARAEVDWGGFFEPNFSSFISGSSMHDDGAITFIDNVAKFQNGFGAMIRTKTYCRIDLNTNEIIQIWFD